MTSPRLARTPALTSAGAAAALSAAQVEASAIGVPVTVAVLDGGGAVKLLSRMDGAPLISIETATSKAYAAVAIGLPPDDFSWQSRTTRRPLRASPPGPGSL